MKRLLTLALLAFATPAAAQVSELDAQLDAALDRFSAAYHAADADAVADVYTENALYLAPGDEVVRGRDAIRAIFAGFLGRYEAGNGPTITFDVLDRNGNGDLATEVGYLSIGSPGQEPRRAGKYVVVWVRGADGVWRIHVDGYSDVPREGD